VRNPVTPSGRFETVPYHGRLTTGDENRLMANDGNREIMTKLLEMRKNLIHIRQYIKNNLTQWAADENNVNNTC
jgi:hypothetical protein